MPDPNLFRTEPAGQVYDDYRQGTSFDLDPGKMVIPVAGPDGTPPMVVKTHAAIMTRRVDWTSQRIGGPPNVPLPTAPETGGNDVMMTASVGAATPVITGDGTKRVWEMSGSYEYVFQTPPVFGVDSLPLGASPVDVTPAVTNDLPASIFDPNLLVGFVGRR